MRADYIPPETLDIVLRSMRSENALVMRVALETGLRVGDVISLRRGNICAELDGSAFIAGTAQKTGKPFHKKISAELARKLRAIAPIGDENTHVFSSSRAKSGHRSRTTVWADCNRVRRLLGINAIVTPHSMRKTYAVKVFRERGIQAASDELQHDRITTTMIYAFADRMTSKPQDESGVKKFVDAVADAVVNKLVKKGVIK